MSERVQHLNVPPDWSAVRQKNIIEIIHQGCREDPYRPAIILEDGLVITRLDLLERSQRFAGHLRGRVNPGDRVAVMLDNRVEFMIALFAIVANRGMLVSIAPTAQQHDAGHILADSTPNIAICGAPQKPLLEALQASHPTLRELIVVDGEEPAGLAAFEDPRPLDFAKVECKRDDVITVYYTSGTTGAPKGCMLHHGWWLRVIDVDLRLFRRGWQDRQLCCLPFYYADPAIQLITSLASRGTLVAMRRFSVSRFWDVVAKYDATEILSIASVPALLLKGAPGPNDRDHRIRLAIHAGLPKELHAQLIERYGFHWLDQYGSTEGGIMSRMPVHLAEAMVGKGSLGVEPPGLTVRLVDDEDHDVPAGTPGEALIGGPDLYLGYLGRPEVTAEANRGGWYHSGDVIRRDDRGLMYFVGRKKDMIRRSGENISAAEIEAVLRAHPKVLEVAAIPVPDDLRGEEVKVFILPNRGESITSIPPEELVEYCRKNLAAYKIPRYFEYRTEDFERTPSMRVQKQSLKQDRDDQIKGSWDREKSITR
jgi:carnitine-CoA ligase